MTNVPQVGVAAVLYDDRHRLLTFRRLSDHGLDTYSVPGGHQSIDETPEETAVREVKEEVGLDVHPTARLGVTDTLFPSGLRYTTWFIAVNHRHAGAAYWEETTLDGRRVMAPPQPVNQEPSKHSEVAYRYLDDLLSLPLFAPLAQFLASQISPATRASR